MVKVLPEPVTPEQNLRLFALLSSPDQLGDRLRLVARRLIIGDDPELAPALGLFRPLRPVGDEIPPRLRLLEAGPDRDCHGGHMVITRRPR
jgi:hypothetical protein